MPASELLDLLRGHAIEVDLRDVPLLVIRSPETPPDAAVLEEATRLLRPMPLVVAMDASAIAAPGWEALADVLVDGPDGVDELAARIAGRPIASVTCALLLRGAEDRNTADGLVAESAAFSVLQAGPEFAAWRASNPPRPPRAGDDGPRVRCQREGSVLHVTLSRPVTRNALDRAMRDELVDAFAIARADRGLDVLLDGEGPTFCAGGDLDEFGTRPDPATAHLIRLERSPASAVAAISSRLTAHVHGACRGSGVELSAFAGHVVSTRDASFGLPELDLGLVPGAGGTVSVTRRIGRHRTAWLALTGRAIDAPTALRWGLVDELVA